MNTHHIEHMVKRLADAGLVASDHTAEAVSVVRGYWTDRIALVWDADDVISEGPGLADGQAEEVLRAVLKGHDASVGVNWDVIQGVAVRLFGETVLEEHEDEENGQDDGDGN